jgi:phosphoglycolate phosphatase
MTRAIAQACQVENGLDGIPVAGRTDTIILADVCAKWGVERDDGFLPAFQTIYFRTLAEELAGLSPDARGVLPGVERLLESLGADDRFTSALLTGNYDVSARLKLERFGLWRHFAFGAFGGDAAERNRLVAVAVERGRAAGMGSVEPGDVIVVGDTPLDVACGRANGARTLAVATGGYSVGELCAAGADYAVPDLSETGAIVEWLESGAVRSC